MQNELFTAFSSVYGNTDAQQAWVKPYEAPEAADTHQFVLFIKPEATNAADGVDVNAVIGVVLDKLAAFDVEIDGARVLPGPYLGTHGIMAQHYGVINRISTQGQDVLTAGAKAKLQDEFGDEIAAGTPVLGGHQFLQEEPAISPLGLSVMNDNIGTTKLGGGSYLMSLNVIGKKYLVLNPFHAYQLVPFTKAGNAIIVLACHSSTPWADLRGKLTGTTNPATAAEGSIRATFLARKEQLGLADVSQGLNGVHLSAGPLEGMVELQRFFTDHEAGTPLSFADTSFGKLLARKGVQEERINELAGNPDIGGESAFDLTEEIDAEESATRLLG